jgi:hypothetical protein
MRALEVDGSPANGMVSSVVCYTTDMEPQRMSSPENKSAAENAAQATEASPKPTQAEPRTIQRGLVAGPLRTGIAGLTMGLIAWQLIHWTYPYFEVPEAQAANPSSPTEEELTQMGLAHFETIRKDATVTGLILGGLAGLLFALVEGISQGGMLRTLAITGISAVLGTCMGALGGFFSMTFQWTYRFDPSLSAMMREIGIQGIFWIAMAAGVGLGVAPYARRVTLVLSALAHTILGAVLFAIVYVPLAGLVFPTDRGEKAVPYSSANVAVWALLAFGIMGLMLGLARSRQQETTESSASPSG